MYSDPILIAETDAIALHTLPRILSDGIPGITVDICSSVAEAARKMQRTKFGAVITSTPLVYAQEQLLVKRRKAAQILVPLIVTADRSDAELAAYALQNEAFDLIVKPIQPPDAVNTVRLAVWQNRLLKLLASKEKAVSLFQQHMDAYPDQEPQHLFDEALLAVETTLKALDTSMQRIKQPDNDLLFQIALAVEEQAKQRALDRLFRLYTEGATH